jgi:membrane complex biogenesis BtpA family protein
MVTDQGVIEGDAARTMRERSLFAKGVAVLADVAVKHAYPLGDGFDLAEAAKDAAFRGLADGLIVTGRATGAPAAIDDLKTVAAAAPGVPILAGSGVTRDSVRSVLRVAGGVIVGTALKHGGRVEGAVDRDVARAFAAEARRA